MNAMTDKQFEQMMAERRQKQKDENEKKEKCSSCGARIDRERQMGRFNEDILRFIKNNRIAKLDSCIFCVKKHVGRAMIYADELLSAENSGTSNGTAAVNVPMNILKIIGHLGCAIEESEEFADIHAALIKAERQFRYEGITPDWQQICDLIDQVPVV